MKLEKATDILEVAVRIERRSVELYLSLFRQIRSARSKEAFSVLAADEEKHLGQLRLLLEEISDTPPQYLYPGEYELFVDGAAARSLESCYDREKILTAGTAREAVLLARDLEECLIAFYTDICKTFEGKDRAVLDALLAEEKEHLERIEELLGTYPEEDPAAANS